MKELVIIENEQEKEIALVEEGILKEYYREKDDTKRLEGNIYSGKVIDVIGRNASSFCRYRRREKSIFTYKRCDT